MAEPLAALRVDQHHVYYHLRCGCCLLCGGAGPAGPDSVVHGADVAAPACVFTASMGKNTDLKRHWQVRTIEQQTQ